MHTLPNYIIRFHLMLCGKSCRYPSRSKTPASFYLSRRCGALHEDDRKRPKRYPVSTQSVPLIKAMVNPALVYLSMG